MPSLDRPLIFKETAPDYYALGLSVIPLFAMEKKPRPLGWSEWADKPVPEEQQRAWMAEYPDGNIGLVLGKQSNIVMIDIDTEDLHLSSVLQALLPKSPWVRIGAKGMVMAYRFSGVPTFRIKNTSGQTIVEHLSSRTQCVLPPSIHPDTKKPYVSNCNLIDVLNELPYLDKDIESILRSALADAGVDLSQSGWSKVLDFASAGSRDTSLTERAGLFAYVIMRGERTFKDAVGMLRAYAADFTEEIAGDPIDVEKHVNNLVKFLHRDVYEKKQVLPSGWDEGLTPEDKKHYGLDFKMDDEEWPFEVMKEHLRDEFDRYPKDSLQRADCVEKALIKIAGARNYNRIEEDRLLDYIASTGLTGVKIGTLRNRIKDLRKGNLRGEDHSEIARAYLADLELMYPVRFYNGMIWKWAGSHWEKVDENNLMAKVSTAYGHLQACKRLSDVKSILNLTKILMKSEIKTSDIKGVNFANGFLTEELKLLAHDMSYGMTYTMPFRYLPEEEGKADMFFEFLDRSWGHDEDYKDKILALQEALCVTLFGIGPKFQRAILLHGAPKSGKSQLLKVVAAVVPDGARCTVPPDGWNDKFMPTSMNEKILNIAGELSEKKSIDGQKFKDIVDGTEIPGQLKGGQIFNFSPRCTHWFAGNHYPKTEDTSEGFNRRWLVLGFNKPVTPQERRLDFGDIIVAMEREAIVAWAVKAMSRLKQQNDFTIPSSHTQIMREVANINNSVRFFITESGKVRITTLQLIDSAEKKILTPMSVEESTIYRAYFAFCIGVANAKPVGSNGFRAKMRELGTELGFKISIVNTPNGGQIASYENIILVSGQASGSTTGEVHSGKKSSTGSQDSS